MTYLCIVKINVHKYPEFDDYYFAVISRLDSDRVDKTTNELREFVYWFYYKDVADVQAINIIQSFYSIYRCCI